eukprot:2968336-Pleurochrysis_carterae.AAC.1
MQDAKARDSGVSERLPPQMPRIGASVWPSGSLAKRRSATLAAPAYLQFVWRSHAACGKRRSSRHRLRRCDRFTAQSPTNELVKEHAIVAWFLRKTMRKSTRAKAFTFPPITLLFHVPSTLFNLYFRVADAVLTKLHMLSLHLLLDE